MFDGMSKIPRVTHGGLQWFTEEHGPILLADRCSWTARGPDEEIAQRLDEPEVVATIDGNWLAEFELRRGVFGLMLGGDSQGSPIAAYERSFDELIILVDLGSEEESHVKRACEVIPGSHLEARYYRKFVPRYPEYSLVLAPVWDPVSDVIHPNSDYPALRTAFLAYRIATYWLAVTEDGVASVHWNPLPDEERYSAKFVAHSVIGRAARSPG